MTQKALKRTETSRTLGSTKAQTTDYEPTTRTEERGQSVRTQQQDTPEVTTTRTQKQHHAIRVTMQIPFLGKEPVTPT